MKTPRILSLMCMLALTTQHFQAQWRTCTPVYIQDVGWSVVTLGSTVLVGISDGIFVSTDNGSTWNRAATTNAWVYSYAVSGSNVFAATAGRGVYRSTDGGRTWLIANSGMGNQNLWAITTNGASTFAGGSNGLVYRSTDNGASWISTSAGLPVGIVNGLAMVGSNVFVVYRAGQVYMSTDNGASWTLKGTAATGPRTLFAAGTKLFAGAPAGGYSSTDNGVTWTACSGLPSSVRAFMGTSPNLYAGTSLGVYRSTDNGATWTATSGTWSNGQAWGVAIGSGRMFAGSDMGAAVSADNGATWNIVSQQWVKMTFTTLAANGSTLFAGSASSLFSTSDLGTTWSGLGANASALLVSGGKVFAGSSGIFASTNNGASWVQSDSGMPASATVFQNAMAANGSNLFVGTKRGTFLSTNGGVVWTPVNSGLVSYDTGASGFAFVGSTVFAGTFDRGIYRSTNNGTSWTSVNAGLTDSVIYALGANGSSVFAATMGAGVFLSSNSGTTWAPVNTGLAPFAVNQFVTSGSQVYAASLGDGVYATKNNGTTWVSAGLNGQSVGSLAIVGSNLVATTYAGAVYWRPISEMKLQTITFQADLSTLLLSGFNPATDSIVVEGFFNSWNATHKMMRVGSTSVWQEVLTVAAASTDSLEFKFRMYPVSKYSNAGWENGPNRVVHLTGSDQTLTPIAPLIAFVPPIVNNVTAIFQVDMNSAHEIYGGTTIANVKSMWMAGDGKPLIWPPNSFTFPDTLGSLVRMYDDGTNGDIVPGDGIWTAMLTFLKSDTVRKSVQYKFAANYPGVQTLNGGIRYLDNEFPDGTNRLVTLVDSTGAYVQTYYQKFGVMGATVTVDSTAPAAPRSTAITPNTWSQSNQFTITWSNPFVSTGVTTVWYTIDAAPTAGNVGTQAAVTATPSLQVTIPTAGVHTVYVYLGNGVGRKNTATAVALKAKFDNIAPQVTHDSTSIGTMQITAAGVLQSAPPSIVASASDNESGVQSMTIGYKRSGDPIWATTAYGSSGTLPIPSNMFTTSSGVEYQITATDSAGNKKTKAFSITIQIVGSMTSPAALLPPASGQSGDKTMAYRMISVPYDIPDKRPLTVLSDLGAHEQGGVPYVNWRLWRMDISPQDYEGFKNDTAFSPGKGYFLIVNDANKTFSVGSGKLVSAKAMYEKGIQLSTGWNSVGDPFPFNVAYDSLFTFPVGVITGHAYFSGTTSGTNGWELNTGGANILRPWEGLAIKLSQPAMLRFKTGLTYLGKTPAILPSAAIQPIAVARQSKSSCLVTLKALRADNGLGVNDLVFGYSDNLPEEQSLYNWPSPPLVISDGVAAFFRDNGEELIHDIHATSIDGDQWPFHLQTRDEGVRVKLDFQNINAVTARGWKLYLLDLDQRMAYDLTVHPSVTVGSSSKERNFRIVAGTGEFVSTHADGITLLPTKAVLSQNYPNPFNPSTVLRYSVPDAAAPSLVQLKVFNILGQLVATLVDGTKEAGYYEQEFNARSLASGVYLYRMTVTESLSGKQIMTETRKMVLLR